MKISYNWLQDYVRIKIPAESLAERLTMAGLEVKDCQKVGDDSVLDIEITSNRPDCLSHIGIAREAAAVTGSKLKAQSSKLKAQSSKNTVPIKINIEDKNDCPLYTARIIQGLKVGLSPDWLKRRLEAIGLRSVNNIVDITNFVLLDNGQPTHAFDLDKIAARQGGQKQELEIIVRRAKQGEKIITIDGINRELSSEVLVIADKLGPIAIAGVIGGKDTEVDSSTKAVLLESAYFSPKTVRRSRQKLGLVTESSYRFERSVHIPTVCSSQLRVEQLLTKICPNANYSKIFQTKSPNNKNSELCLDVDIGYVNNLLGLNLKRNEVISILNKLQIHSKPKGTLKINVTVPDFRPDLKISEDIAEEIARIYGYDNIKFSLPVISSAARVNADSVCKDAAKIIKRILCASGFSEVISYSLVSKDKTLILENKAQAIAIANPLSKEQEFLRPDLIAGLLDIAKHNFNHGQEEVNIFEISPQFRREDNVVKERLCLGLLACGRRINDWFRQAAVKQKIQVCFFDVKGALESTFDSLGIIDKISFKRLDSNIFVPGQAATVCMDDVAIGFLGAVKESLLRDYGIRRNNIFLSMLDLESILPAVNLKKTYKKFSAFPGMSRDISFVIAENFTVKGIENSISQKGIATLEKISLFDEYKDASIPKGFRSLSFSFDFRAKERTLKEEEVTAAVGAIKNLLKEKFSVTFR
jgi:phenylalanyl-tRNA synthetase beta chain